MNPYEILQINQGANKDEIKKAFRKLAHIHHPDKGGDEQKFKEINEAYQLLMNDKYIPPIPAGFNVYQQVWHGYLMQQDPTGQWVIINL